MAVLTAALQSQVLPLIPVLPKRVETLLLKNVSEMSGLTKCGRIKTEL
jgi:hypothetical protein